MCRTAHFLRRARPLRTDRRICPLKFRDVNFGAHTVRHRNTSRFCRLTKPDSAATLRLLQREALDDE